MNRRADKGDSKGLSGRGFRPQPAQLRVAAAVLAALLAANGARILNDSPTLSAPYLRNFDASMPWLGLALVALTAAAWPANGLPTVRFSAAGARDFWRAHRAEIILFTAIFAFGVFMRIFRFQGTLPAPDGLCCEEHINGGVAYKALLGDRPLNFLITRWGSAAGFALFGENTLGLRFFFPMMSIVTLIAFYALLRRLVSVPAALFGFALFAAAWWPALRARQASEGTIYAVLFALAFVAVLRSKHPIAALLTGVLAGLLSYEYEPFKAIPIIAAIFLAAAAVREVLFRGSLSIETAVNRFKTLAANATRPLTIGLMAAGIVLVPMIIGTHKGYDLYLTSVHRQEAGREGDRIADNWRTQLKWAGEIFLPFGPNEYVASPPRDVAGTDLIDPATAWLAILGLLSSALLLHRGLRGFFVLWLGITLGAAAVLLHDFGPWKFVVLVPVVVTFAAFLAEDAWNIMRTRWGDAGGRIALAMFVVAAAFSMWWNADTLFNEAGPSDSVQGSYGGEASLVYSVCRELKDGEPDAYAYASSGTPSIMRAFASPRGSEDEEARAWGDLVWACHGLQGTGVPAPEELWPVREAPAGRDIALAATDPPSADALVALLGTVYPGLRAPVIESGPGERHRYLLFNVPPEDVTARQGLFATYSSGGETMTRIDDVTALSWAASPPPLAGDVSARWQGLIYLAEPGVKTLQAQTTAPVSVTVDGSILYATGAQPQEPAVRLEKGWHVAEIAMEDVPRSGGLSLRWVADDGSVEALRKEDVFALQDLAGWTQTRTLGLPGGLDQTIEQRLDVAPHTLSASTLALLAQHDGLEPELSELRWSGVWHVGSAGDYELQAAFRSGQLTLLVDGQQVAQSEDVVASEGLLTASLTLSEGPHHVEIVQVLNNRSEWAGATITALLGGSVTPMRVTPY